jgi:UDP-N-acetylglucosamine--N-acetylmuramyl-(pentapeptide) pyrophosphoryl-undecaprenol N-acetylglucosamine transferase
MTAPLAVLTAGGTGGHVFPAQALAEALKARGFRLALITDRRGGHYGDAFPGVEIFGIRAGALMGRGLVARIKATGELGIGYFEARRLLQRLRPRVVVGFGGYASVPTMLAAAHLGMPTLIHEQNAVLGRANRLLAPRVQRIATSFAQVAKLSAPAARIALTGNPVRPAIAALFEKPYLPPEPAGRFALLMLGGSQGATILGRTTPQALALLPEAVRRRLQASLQVRAEDVQAAETACRAAGIEADIRPFFTDVPERLARAHLLICRSGASTVAEVTTAGRPALFVPFAAAADDHQTANAAAVVQVAGAWLMAQAELAPESLANQLAGLIADPSALAAAAAATRKLARPDAAARLAEEVIRLAGRNGADQSRQAA